MTAIRSDVAHSKAGAEGEGREAAPSPSPLPSHYSHRCTSRALNATLAGWASSPAASTGESFLFPPSTFSTRFKPVGAATREPRDESHMPSPLLFLPGHRACSTCRVSAQGDSCHSVQVFAVMAVCQNLGMATGSPRLRVRSWGCWL